MPFRVVFERVKNAESQGHAVIKSDLYQFISTISLLYFRFFKDKQVTLNDYNSLNRELIILKGILWAMDEQIEGSA